MEWYNGDPVTSDERGFLFQYNLLIGGILIVQERGIQKSCEGMYSLFYPVCYTTDTIVAEPPRKNNGTHDYDDTRDPAYLAVSLRLPFAPASALGVSARRHGPER